LAASLSSSEAFDVAYWQIVLQKSFWADQRKFVGPLMRFARGDLRGPHRLSQNRPRTSYRRYSALQRQGSPKINFREIFGVVRFSTFATVSARNGHGAMSDLESAMGCKADIDEERQQQRALSETTWAAR
jgi:hypothetical protein